MLWVLVVLGAVALAVWLWVRWARQAEWDKQSPGRQAFLEHSRKAAVTALTWLARHGEKLGKVAQKLDHGPLTQQELLDAEMYRALRPDVPPELDAKLSPWPEVETIFNRHIHRMHLDGPHWNPAVEAGIDNNQKRQMADKEEKAKAERDRQAAEAKRKEEERQRIAKLENTLPTPKHYNLGPEFPDAETFQRWVRLTPTGGLKLGTGIEPRGPFELVIPHVDQEFSNPHALVSFAAYAMIPKLRMGYRFSHHLGNLSQRQMFFMKWNRVMELIGAYDHFSESLKERHEYYCQQYVGTMFLDAKPGVEHFVIGSYGDRFEEQFQAIKSRGIEWMIPDEHLLVEEIMGPALEAAKQDSPIGEFARRFVSPSGGWATAR